MGEERGGWLAFALVIIVLVAVFVWLFRVRMGEKASEFAMMVRDAIYDAAFRGREEHGAWSEVYVRANYGEVCIDVNSTVVLVSICRVGMCVEAAAPLDVPVNVSEVHACSVGKETVRIRFSSVAPMTVEASAETLGWGGGGR